MKEIKEDKDKPLFEKLLLMIDEPLLIIREKMKLLGKNEEHHEEKVSR